MSCHSEPGQPDEIERPSLRVESQMRSMYGDGSGLDTKWDVMRRYRVANESLEEAVLRLADPSPDDAVLDVGTGTGRYARVFAEALAEGGGQVVALDPNPRGLEPLSRWTASRSVAIQTECSSLEDWNTDHQFDLVIAGHVVYHFANIPAALVRIGSLLKPGGRFIAITNSKRGMPDLIRFHRAAASRLNIESELPASDGPFTLENGESILKEAFSKVTTHIYDGGFAVKDPAPIFLYYASTSIYARVMMDETLQLEQRIKLPVAYLSAVSEDLEESSGALKIEKDVGIFVCEAPR